MRKVYLIAVVCALIAGFATFLFAKELSEKSSFLDAQKATVITAVAEVPQNTTITQENFAQYFTTSEIVSSYVLKDAITNTADAVNTVTRQTLYPGEQLTLNKLITSESDDATLSLTLPDGYVAYPISAAGTESADGYISIGDKVDVYVFSGNTARIPLSNLEVLRVSNKAANVTAETDGTEINEYSTLTLIVTEQQALDLMEIENGGENFKLVLKPRVSGSVTEKLDKEKNNNENAAYAAVE